jgi:TolB-like protein
MKRIKSSFIKAALVLTVVFMLPPLTVNAGGNRDLNGSEVVVQRIDNNELIRLRIWIDGRIAGAIKVGETSIYKIKNGPHTIRASFEDYQARSTEVTQFNVNNARVMFSVTDESIVAMGNDWIGETKASAAPVGSDIPSYTNIETSVVNAFNNATNYRQLKGRRVAVINVDSDNIEEADYLLEEITYLAVKSNRNFKVIDRREIDAFRSENGIGVPSYNNDYILRHIGDLIGADFVITGRLDGDGDLRRLRVKVLDVKTGLLVGNASENV